MREPELRLELCATGSNAFTRSRIPVDFRVTFGSGGPVLSELTGLDRLGDKFIVAGNLTGIELAQQSKIPDVTAATITA